MASEELDFSSRLTDRCGSANSFSDENLREIDFYGNNGLHQCFASNGNIVDSEESIKKIKKILRIFPNSAFSTNQFGRLPIHYALDRIRVSTNALDILYEHFKSNYSTWYHINKNHDDYDPSLRDSEGNTPYSLSVKWDHSSKVKIRMLKLMLLTLLTASSTNPSNNLINSYHNEENHIHFNNIIGKDDIQTVNDILLRLRRLQYGPISNFLPIFSIPSNFVNRLINSANSSYNDSSYNNNNNNNNSNNNNNRYNITTTFDATLTANQIDDNNVYNYNESMNTSNKENNIIITKRELSTGSIFAFKQNSVSLISRSDHEEENLEVPRNL